MIRVISLVCLALVVFVVAVVIIHIAMLLGAAAVVDSSCGENCYNDVYLGAGFLVANVIASSAIAGIVVRYVAGRTRRSPG